MRVRPANAIKEGSSLGAVYLVWRNRFAYFNCAPVDMQHLSQTLIGERFAVQLITTAVTGDGVVAFHPFVTFHKIVVHGPSVSFKCFMDKHIINVVDFFRFFLELSLLVS